MRVSVVVPLYNKARHIQRAISSVLAQTYQAFEIIVVDDGSTDGGGDIVRQITDLRLRLIPQTNAGVSAARNRGIQESSCELIAFLDADDEWMPNHLETLMALRSRYPESGMYATAYRFCEGKKTWRPAFTHCVTDSEGGLLEDYFRSAFGPPPVWTSAVMIPKSVFNETGCFPVGVRRGQDLWVWAQIALRYRVAWSPVEGAIYHLSSDNRACLVVPANLDPEAAFVAPIEEFLRSGVQPVTSRYYVEEYCVFHRLRYAILCYLRGERSWALSHISKTRASLMFRKQRMLLQCIIWLPSWLIKAVMRLTSAMHIKINFLHLGAR